MAWPCAKTKERVNKENKPPDKKDGHKNMDEVDQTINFISMGRNIDGKSKAVIFLHECVLCLRII